MNLLLAIGLRWNRSKTSFYPLFPSLFPKMASVLCSATSNNSLAIRNRMWLKIRRVIGWTKFLWKAIHSGTDRCLCPLPMCSDWKKVCLPGFMKGNQTEPKERWRVVQEQRFFNVLLSWFSWKFSNRWLKWLNNNCWSMLNMRYAPRTR